jgi:hypothetical protein
MTDLQRERQPAAVDRHRGPSLAALAVVYAALFGASLIVPAVLSGGAHFPSPFIAETAALRYFREHAGALLAGAFFQFGAAVPLGIFTATAVSRLRFLGVRVAGPSIALFGGTAAALLLTLSALTQWVLAQPGAADSAAVVRTLHLLAFGTGGPAHVVALGLLLAGIAVPCLFLHLLPRWLAVSGLVLAALAELATFSLVVPAASYLLPAARFPAFLWLIACGAMLPKSRQPSAGEGGAPTGV